MSEARDMILGKIRRALGRISGQGLDSKPPHPGAGPIPSRAEGDLGMRVQTFTEWAQKARAGVSRVSGSEHIGSALAGFLSHNGLPLEVTAAPYFQPHEEEWVAAGLKPCFGTAPDHGLVGITPAFAGIAETGTCVMLSGPNHPSRLNMLPDNHMVILALKDIVGSYEEAWDKVLATGPLPRTVLWVTGPSLTGDIEQTLQQGAHGPRRLHIFIVG